ncbi:MAG: hypothetical protein GYB65_05195 [Chloroflexi bacterium]|nr:hypothetical protein [Chloroflexota bacterium]
MFKQRWMLACVLGLLLAGLVLPAQAQGGSQVEFVAFNSDNIMVAGAGSNVAPATIPPGFQVTGGPTTWTPDGSQFLFTALNLNEIAAPYVMLSNGPNTEAAPVAGDVMTAFPFAFTASGELVYTARTGQMVAAEGPGGEMINVMQLALNPVGTPELIGSFVWGVGCGGGGNIPAMWRLSSEWQAGPGGSPMILAVTPYGIVHSTNCGGRGVALFDFATTTDTVIDAELGWVAVSPDGEQLAGVRVHYDTDGTATRELVLVNLSNLVSTVQPTPGMPQVVTWSAAPDSTNLYFTVVEETARFPADAEQQQRMSEALDYMEPTTLPINTVTVYQQNIVTTETIPVHQIEAYAIGRLHVLSDESGLVFSVIPSLDTWGNLVLTGGIDPWDSEMGLSVTLVELHHLNLADGSVSLLGTDLNQSVIKPVQ